MPSTYTLNNGIELIGTGEQSGSWGDTTNTNFELIDTALDGQVTVTLASAGTSGSPNALPISDGASSDGRNRMIIFNDGADLGATAYVQLTPNDAEKIVYIRNDLSGSRSIIVFQGTYSASNDYEIPAGTTAVIYFNGGGAGAVAANVFNNAYFDSLRLGGVSVTAIIDDDTMATAAATNIPTAESVKAYVDAQVGANNELSEVLANGNTTGGTDIAVSTGDDITFADNSKAIFGAGSDLQIYHDGTRNYIDSNTTELRLQTSELRMVNSSNTEIGIKAVEDGAVTLYYDAIARLATTSTGVDITGGLVVDTNTLYVDSTNNRVGIGTSSPSRALTVYDASNSVVSIQTGSSGTSQLAFGDADDDVGKIYYEHTSNRMVFNTATSAQMNINASGRLSIGFGDGTSEYYQAPINVGSTESNIASFVRYTSTQNGPSLYIGKSRSGTVGVNTVVQDGDDLGFIQFTGADGTNYRPAAQIQVEVDGTPGTDDMPGRLIFKTTPDGSITATERMRIHSSGDISMSGSSGTVGTLKGRGSLTISDNHGDNTGGAVAFHYTGNGGYSEIYIENNNTLVLNADPTAVGSNTYIKFRTDNVLAAMIDDNQRVLVGGTSSVGISGYDNYLQLQGTGGAAAGLSVQRYNNGAGGGVLNFGKTRSTTVGTVGTVVQDGDALGYVLWAGDDGTDITSNAAWIFAAVDGTPGSNDMPGRLVFSTTSDGAVTPTERMRIDSSGNVTIGNTAQGDTKLFISQGLSGSVIEPYITLESDTASGGEANGVAIDFFPGGSKNTLPNRYARIAGIETSNSGGNTGLAFYTTSGDNAPEEAMRINSGKRVLINSELDQAVAGGTGVLQVMAVDESTPLAMARFQSGTSAGPFMMFGKSRSSTVGSYAILQEDDTTGIIRFAGDDGTDLTSRTAEIYSEVDGTPGLNDMPGRLVFATTADGAQASTERMRISQNGDVDIGQTGGGAKLAIAGAVGTQNGGQASPTHTFYSDNDTGMYRAAADNIGWSTGGKEGMRLNSSQELIVSDGFSTITGGVSRLTVGGGSTDTQGVSIGRFTSNASGTWLNFFKSNSDNWNTHALVSANTSIAEVAAYASDATNYLKAASIEMDVDGTAGTNDMPGVIKFNTTADGASSPTERMRINSSGTTTIYGDLHFSKNSSSSNFMEIRFDDSDGAVGSNQVLGKITAYSSDAQRNGIVGEIAFVYQDSSPDANIEFKTYQNSTDTYKTAWKIQYNGALLNTDSSAPANIVMASGTGIQFQDAGGSGTSSSNTLDSYEEGTWTPVLLGYSGVTYSTQIGFYTKIGRTIVLQFEMAISSVGTYTGNSRIGGLPFSAGSSSTETQSSQISVMTALNATRNDQYVAIYNGGSDLFVYSNTGSPYNGNQHQAGRYSGVVVYMGY